MVHNTALISNGLLGCHVKPRRHSRQNGFGPGVPLRGLVWCGVVRVRLRFGRRHASPAISLTFQLNRCDVRFYQATCRCRWTLALKGTL